MSRYVLEFREIDQAQIAHVGGKGANLGELWRIAGIDVPDGFCLTTDAWRRILADLPDIDVRIERLARLQPDDRQAIQEESTAIRARIAGIAMPEDLATAIADALARLGAQTAVAVRSSATAEDLPTASFAGQQESYLNVIGPEAVLRHISQCWASLFTERAVAYRLRNGIDHRSVRMAMIVQRMVVPDAAGTLFTADPVSGNRKVTSIEASYGLGEALVSGIVNADVYTVRGDTVIARTIGGKEVAIRPAAAGGTAQQAITPERRDQAALTDAQAVRLAQLGRRIEAHFGRPQDIEWCLADGAFQIVQSRPITTLYPIPVANDGENHVYISVGHQQMMTDAMKPLGMSFWQLITPRPMAEAGGRLFVDVTPMLASSASRASLLALAGRSDPLIGDALRRVLDRGDFIPEIAADDAPPPLPAASPDPIATDPAIVNGLIARCEASIVTLKQEIRGRSGPDLLAFIETDLQELRRILFDPQSHQVIMAGMEATWWLNEHLQEWLGEKNVADTLTLSVPNNVTSDMGLALLDVADAIRPHREVVALLEQAEGDAFLDELPRLPGGAAASAAIHDWLERYGMRGVGEIDITTPRWRERPGMLLPILLGHVRNFVAGERARRFAQGQRMATAKEREILERLRALPDGERKAEETKRMIDRVRTFTGYREYPKYGMVCRTFVYKQALLEEAKRLARAGVIRAPDDISYLTFQELQEAVRTQQVDHARIRERKEAHRANQALTPPRVLTSDGEMISGSYRREDVPAGALAGLAVSAGRVEGRARVIRDVASAALEPGDILVTAFTDPSWTPLFVSIAGLVTEVGGLMTHGAVIAREYGLPAVVGVEHATQKIRDGQRIRLHGTDGYVELLD